MTGLDFYGGNPFEPAETMYGLGFAKIFSGFFQGLLFDAHRVPFFSIFVFIGILGTAIYYTKNSFLAQQFQTLVPIQAQLYFLLNLFLFFLFVIGPAGFPLLRYFPGIDIIHFSRFWSGLDMFAIIFAGIGFCFLFCFLSSFHTIIASHIKIKRWAINQKKWEKIWVLLICGILSFSLLYLVAERYARFKEVSLVFDFKEDDPEYLEILNILHNLPDGRVLAVPTTGIESHFRIYSPQLYAKKPTYLTYAVGTQDSLGYYYVEFLKTKPRYIDLFNTKYIIATAEKNYTFAAAPLYANRNYTLYITNASGYFDFITTNTAILTDNKRARNFTMDWTSSKMFDENNFLTIGGNNNPLVFMEKGYKTIISFEDDEKIIHLFSLSPNENLYDSLFINTTDFNFSSYLEESSLFHGNALQCGNITSQYVDDGYYNASVYVSTNHKEQCYLMLKVNAHKDWRVTVDGQKKEWIQVSPSFMAVSVSSGEHIVEFEFGISSLRIGLLFLSPLVMFTLWFAEIVLKRNEEKRK